MTERGTADLPVSDIAEAADVSRQLVYLAAFLTGGWGDFIHTWVVEGPNPWPSEEFTDRLLRTASALLSLSPDQEGSRR